MSWCRPLKEIVPKIIVIVLLAHVTKSAVNVGQRLQSVTLPPTDLSSENIVNSHRWKPWLFTADPGPTGSPEELGPKSSYRQQRNGLLSFAEWIVPEQPPPRSNVKNPVLTAWTAPANIGQSPPQVKHILHATAVCALATGATTALRSIASI